jgi:glycosyltransferase involved in cell wall biosynthesis
MEKVFIALATRNGAAYLEPLLGSVRGQSHTAWTLLVRDDQSSDATVGILRRTACEDRRIVHLEDDLGRLGPAANFGLLMRHASQRGAEYLLFADQDDVWQPDKVERQLSLMRRQEATRGQRTPQLVYSDLRVVDAEARTVHPSFLRLSRLRHGEGRPLRTLLGRSFVLGCACLINRPLLEFALPMPRDAASHDWWVALCGAAIGWISYLPEPTLSYRRHGSNASGPANFWAGLNPLRHPWQKRWETGVGSFRHSVAQAESLRQRLHDRGPAVAAEEALVIDQFCGLFRRPSAGWDRVVRLCRLGIPAIDLPRRLLYYLCVLTLSRRTDLKSVLPNLPCVGKQAAGKLARYAA